MFWQDFWKESGDTREVEKTKWPRKTRQRDTLIMTGEMPINTGCSKMKRQF